MVPDHPDVIGGCNGWIWTKQRWFCLAPNSFETKTYPILSTPFLFLKKSIPWLSHVSFQNHVFEVEKTQRQKNLPAIHLQKKTRPEPWNDRTNQRSNCTSPKFYLNGRRLAGLKMHQWFGCLMVSHPQKCVYSFSIEDIVVPEFDINPSPKFWTHRNLEIWRTLWKSSE